MSLAEAIRSAVGGRKARLSARIEDERPEDLEDEEHRDAEGDERDPDAEDDRDEDGSEEDQETGATGEDEDLEEGEKTPDARKAHARGRTAERRRMAVILGSAAAEGNPGLAAHLAFSTSMRASDALSALAAAGNGGAGASSGKLAGKMAASRQPRLGGNAAQKTDARSATVEGVKSVMNALHRRK